MNRAWVEIAAEMRDAGASPETYLLELRRRGANIIECIKAVRSVECIGLGEAKEVVHFSQAWADRRVANERLHDEVIEALGIDE